MILGAACLEERVITIPGGTRDRMVQMIAANQVDVVNDVQISEVVRQIIKQNPKITTFTAANQGVQRSRGQGALRLDRGSLDLSVGDGAGKERLSGERTAQRKVWSGSEYRGAPWNSSRWYGSQWASSRWYSTRWYGTDFTSSRWYSTRWYGSRWYAIAWE